MTLTPIAPPRRAVAVTVDGSPVKVPEGSTLLDACRALDIETPTLCFLETLTPINACRVCVVELEGSRTLVPACSRRVEDGMAVRTDSNRVRHSRKLVLELLASSVDLSTAAFDDWMARYGVDPGRFGPAARPDEPGDRHARQPGHHHVDDPHRATTVAEPPKIDNELYVRDYAKCILCYKCVEACGEDAQNTFAIAVAGRGFDARISTEFDVPLPQSACVYCGNCIAVCPTGALVGTVEFQMRRDGTWDEAEQTVTRTICPFCGVGCNLDLHVQDNRVVRVDSPLDHSVTNGNLCIKGRFGWAHLHGE